MKEVRVKKDAYTTDYVVYAEDPKNNVVLVFKGSLPDCKTIAGAYAAVGFDVLHEKW